MQCPLPAPTRPERPGPIAAPRRRRRGARAALPACLLLAAILPSGSAAAQSQASKPPSEPLTTEEFRYRDERLQATFYDLLRLPELYLRLALTPTYPVVRWAEDVALDDRLTDLLTNEARTSLLLPTLSLFGSDPLGVGFLYTHSDLLGGEQQLWLAAGIKTNQDYKVEARYAQPVVWLDGRIVTVAVEHRLNHNERYFGLGPGAVSPDPMALGVRETRGLASLTLMGPETSLNPLSMRTTLAYYRREDFPGTDAAMPSATAAVGPPGFEQPHDYLELTQSFYHDLRDSAGRTDRGTLFALDLHATSEIGAGDLSAARAALSATYFLPLAPRHRVLVGHVGAAGVTPMSKGDQIPIQSLISLGRSTYPRGYAPFRFRHEKAWWASVEYRYPVFDLGLAGSGASSMLFVDAAQGGSGFRDWFESELRYSYGLGLRLETMSSLLVRFQVGFSPEGAELLLSLNEAYADD